MNIVEAMRHPRLFGPAIRDHGTFAAWYGFICALFGLPMSEEQLRVYQQCTGRTEPPQTPFSTAWLICGRRAGKSFVLAIIAVFLACFKTYADYLTLGERATIMVIASDRKQARSILRYVDGLLNLPAFKGRIERPIDGGFDLTNRVTIEITTCSIKAVRGYTIAACLADEIAFWQDDNSVSPADEVIESIRPGMATIPGAMLLCASSPYSRRGPLWEAYRAHFAKDDAPELVWQAATRTMNPTVPQSLIDARMKADPAAALSEYGAQFRADLEEFVPRETVEACVIPGRFEIPAVNAATYHAFVDPSGGSQDGMTLAIGHKDWATGHIVLDCVREREPPFSPESVVREFAETMRLYRISKVCGDRYGGEWPRERFREHGIDYECSAKPRSDLYRDTLPLLNSGKVELLDKPKLITQFCSLERRTGRGRDSIDHAPGAHDDLANSVAGLIAGFSYLQEFDLDLYIKAYS